MASSHEFPTEGTIYLMLPMGSKVCIGLIDNDGEVTVTFTDREFKIEVDMPDSMNRCGEIYNERFAEDFEKQEVIDVEAVLDGGIDGPYNETEKSMTLLEHDRDDEADRIDAETDRKPFPFGNAQSAENSVGQINAAIDKYHKALTDREHGGIAASRLVDEVQVILGRHWHG